MQRDPGISRGKQLAPEDHNMDSDDPNTRELSTDLLIELQLDQGCLRLSPDEMSHGAQGIPNCANLFTILKTADWSPLYLSERTSLESGVPAVIWEGLSRWGRYCWSRDLYRNLQTRQKQIQAHQSYQQRVENTKSDGVSRNKTEMAVI
jgi:hypothetical protein